MSSLSIDIDKKMIEIIKVESQKYEDDVKLLEAKLCNLKPSMDSLEHMLHSPRVNNEMYDVSSYNKTTVSGIAVPTDEQMEVESKVLLQTSH